MLPTKPQGWKLHCCSNMWLQNTVSNTQLNVKLQNSYFGLNEGYETRGINPSSHAGRKYTSASSSDRRLTKLRSVLFLVFIQRPASNLQVSQPSFFCTHKKKPESQYNFQLSRIDPGQTGAPITFQPSWARWRRYLIFPPISPHNSIPRGCNRLPLRCHPPPQPRYWPCDIKWPIGPSRLAEEACGEFSFYFTFRAGSWLEHGRSNLIIHTCR